MLRAARLRGQAGAGCQAGLRTRVGGPGRWQADSALGWLCRWAGLVDRVAGKVGVGFDPS